MVFFVRLNDIIKKNINFVPVLRKMYEQLT